MKDVRELIVHLSRNRKKTILLSSHLLNEIEMVANRMAIIHNGELVVQGDVNALLDKGEKYVIIQAEPRKKVISLLKRQKKVVRAYTEIEGGVRVAMDFENIPALNNVLVVGGVRVKALIPRRSLEDVFLSMTESANQDRA
jgi:ABC-type multidrug transport system ATPase subunit